MKLKNMRQEELELLSYTDLTELILAENNKPMNTPAIFKKICELLEFNDEDYNSKIGDFYTSLTTDKRFLLLDSAEWDLRDRHAVKIEFDNEEEEDDVDEEPDEEVSTDENEVDDIEEAIEDDDLDDDNDIDELAILDDSELEEDS